MTIDEEIQDAIEWIEGLRNGWNDKDNIKYCNMAIKALENKDVLDKIRLEIYRKQYDFMSDGDYNEGIRFGLMLAYQIIDKYKAESEDKT